MPSYIYQAINENGNKASGTLEADSVDAANSILALRGLIPLKMIQEQDKSADNTWSEIMTFTSKVKASDLIIFTKQFRSMLGAGVPILIPKGKAAYRWVRDSAAVLRDTSGIATGLLGTIADVTDQRRILDDLRAEAATGSEVLAAIPDGIAVFDRDLRCTHWSKSMAALTGCTPDATVGKPATDIPIGLDPDELQRILSRVLAGETVVCADAPIAGGQQETSRFLWHRYSPLRRSDGSAGGVVGITTDVTGRKTIENDLRASERVLTNVIDTIEDVLLITDLQAGWCR